MASASTCADECQNVDLPSSESHVLIATLELIEIGLFKSQISSFTEILKAARASPGEIDSAILIPVVPYHKILKNHRVMLP